MIGAVKELLYQKTRDCRSLVSRASLFGIGPFGEKWWVAPLNRDKITPMGMDKIPVTANGIERIEVVDVTDGIASYRRCYFVNPDGEIVTGRLRTAVWKLSGLCQRAGCAASSSA